MLAHLYSLASGLQTSWRASLINLAEGVVSLVEGAMARRQKKIAPSCSNDELAGSIRRALQNRVGVDRYEVWFGKSANISVVTDDSSAPVVVTLTIGNGFSHEWLRKTFRSDVESAVASVCGTNATLQWMENRSEATEKSSSKVLDVSTSDEELEPTSSLNNSSQSDSIPEISPIVARPHRGNSPNSVSSSGKNRVLPSLDSFVVGLTNRMAHAAVELAVNRPGEMSPLFLFGPSGAGKTHLLESYCGLVRDREPGVATVYLSAEQFTTAFLQALHGSGLPGFRRSCRQADILIIDDIHFLIGKKATIEEFQQTIDALLRNGRQMVFAADRDVDSLSALGPDLLVRLKGGIQAQMLPPDEDVRYGIIRGLAKRRSLDIPPDVIHYVAKHITRHTRELVGAVNRLEASSHMLGIPISVGMAEESLVDLVRSNQRSVQLADIERAVCTAFGIESGTLQSSRRVRSVNQPRMLAMFLARKHTASALTEIGSYFGRRSHSTVISAQRKVTTWVDQQETINLANASWDVNEAIRRVEDLLRVG